MHNLRLWSAIACACTIAFVSIVVGVSIHDGIHWDEYAANTPSIGAGTPRSYAVLGSKASKSFDAMGALATIAFACKCLRSYTILCWQPKAYSVRKSATAAEALLTKSCV